MEGYETLSIQSKSRKGTRINFILLLPLISISTTLAVHLLMPMNSDILFKELNYFTVFLMSSVVLFTVLTISANFNKNVGEKFTHKAPFLAGMYLLFNLYNLITLKFNILPQVYFPFPDKILNVFVTDWRFLLKSLFHSTRLQFFGMFFGIISGVITGVLVGWSKRWSYWVNPLIKLVGPIPATAWIPIALVAFPSSITASVFMIALSVWFPTTILTSSGIQNIEKSYFEVASTLGASSKYQILKIALPAAMPSMFVGFFNGICASFLTLMTAEMLGVKYGIGWYINWQREIMAYPNVYAGLIIIAIFCSFFVALLFKIRDRVLVWQKGVIKW